MQPPFDQYRICIGLSARYQLPPWARAPSPYSKPDVHYSKDSKGIILIDPRENGSYVQLPRWGKTR